MRSFADGTVALSPEQHHDWATHRNYISERSIAKLDPTRDNDTASATEAVEFRPITRLDVIGGCPDKPASCTNPTGDTP